MPLPYTSNLKERSARLRHEMTDAEKRLWGRLRLRQIGGHWFYRQKPIGDYIVDFYCPKARLVIEVDGGQHFSGEIIENDRIRDEYLGSLGLKVLRFANNDVLTHIDAVVESIIEGMETSEKKVN